MDLSKNQSQSAMQQFYTQFGIKQYNSFSGGFRYLQKQKSMPQNIESKQKEISRQDLYKQFGLTNAKVKTYKLDNEYVPQTKSQLADKLMQKIQHQRKKMRYYRQKHYGEYVDKYQDKYRN